MEKQRKASANPNLPSSPGLFFAEQCSIIERQAARVVPVELVGSCLRSPCRSRSKKKKSGGPAPAPGVDEAQVGLTRRCLRLRLRLPVCQCSAPHWQPEGLGHRGRVTFIHPASSFPVRPYPWGIIPGIHPRPAAGRCAHCWLSSCSASLRALLPTCRRGRYFWNMFSHVSLPFRFAPRSSPHALRRAAAVAELCPPSAGQMCQCGHGGAAPIVVVVLFSGLQ